MNIYIYMCIYIYMYTGTLDMGPGTRARWVGSGPVGGPGPVGPGTVRTVLRTFKAIQPEKLFSPRKHNSKGNIVGV